MTKYGIINIKEIEKSPTPSPPKTPRKPPLPTKQHSQSSSSSSSSCSSVLEKSQSQSPKPRFVSKALKLPKLNHTLDCNLYDYQTDIEMKDVYDNLPTEITNIFMDVINNGLVNQQKFNNKHMINVPMDTSITQKISEPLFNQIDGENIKEEIDWNTVPILGAAYVPYTKKSEGQMSLDVNNQNGVISTNCNVAQNQNQNIMNRNSQQININNNNINDINHIINMVMNNNNNHNQNDMTQYQHTLLWLIEELISTQNNNNDNQYQSNNLNFNC